MSDSLRLRLSGVDRKRDDTTREPIRIVFVCTGNICRSPFAERVMQARYDYLAPGGFVVSSVGTRAVQGQPMDPSSAVLVEHYEGSAGGFTAKQLTEDSLSGATLVLTMERAHRDPVIELSPTLLHKTFTLAEFTRLAQLAPSLLKIPQPSGLAEWIRAVALTRQRLSFDGGTKDDVADPYGQSQEKFLAMAQRVEPMLNQIAVASVGSRV